MIEIVSPAWLAIIVDGGRHGYADAGVPASAALDAFAYRTLNDLLGNGPHYPALEVMGSDFRVNFHQEMLCAITGARVRATLDEKEVTPWAAFCARKGSQLRVREAMEGLRYYIGFSGLIECERALGSFSTNIECRFGGFHGRPLMKEDVLTVLEVRPEGDLKAMAEEYIPPMQPPYALRVLEGPEPDSCEAATLEAFWGGQETNRYIVSARLNRTGVRLEGRPVMFREDTKTSITSEGVLPGTIQVPGDGMPIVVLQERTIGGYARIAVVARVDLDILAQLKPKDTVTFRRVTIEEAQALWARRGKATSRQG